jgi:hypothetical protein
MTRLTGEFLPPIKEDGILIDKPMGYGVSTSGTPTGGTVTQATNRTTGVTINRISGQITTNTASLAAEATAVFTVTNSFVSATDVVIINQASGSNGGGTVIEVVAVANGSFNIAVQNNNVAAGTAETGAIVINFAVFKAVAS